MIGNGMNEFHAMLKDTAEANERAGGTVRLTAYIRYGQGTGIRFIDVTVEEAERLGVELIQAAQQAHDMAVRRNAELDAQTAAIVARGEAAARA